MAHIQQQEFCRRVRDKYKDFFENKFVLDIGSLDLNGNNQEYFKNSLYLGVDVADGKNVDIISKGHELSFADATFDIIISTECFEHDQYYDKTIKNIYRMLKPGGLLIFSCATTGRPEHGTRRTTPEDAPLLQNDTGWSDYYKNLTQDDIREIFDVEDSFKYHEFSINNVSFDLYFFGFKSGEYEENYNKSFLIDSLPKLFLDNNDGIVNAVPLKSIQSTVLSTKKYVFNISESTSFVNIKFELPSFIHSLSIKTLKLIADGVEIDLLNRVHSNSAHVKGNNYTFISEKPELYINDLEVLEKGSESIVLEFENVNENLKAKVVEVEKENENLKAKVVEVENVNENLKAKVVEVEKENENLKANVIELKNVILQYSQSEFWKITKPIRFSVEKIRMLNSINSRIIRLCKIYGCMHGFIRLLKKLKKDGLSSTIKFIEKKVVVETNIKHSTSQYIECFSNEALLLTKPKFDIVIPSYNDFIVLKECIDSILEFNSENLNQIYICDDKSTNIKHIDYLNSLENNINITIIYGDNNQGFSSNVNRGLKMCNKDHDIFLLNSDIIVKENWSDIIQCVAIGNSFDITGARLLYDNGTVQHGGGLRNFGSPTWFDHKYRIMEKTHFPSVIDNTVLFSTGALLYIRKEAFEKLGYFDESFLMGFEDVDYCLRAWNNDMRVGYCGISDIIHKESITRGKTVGEREKISKKYFWKKYNSWFKRNVISENGKIKVIFVTQDVGIGGGHRVIFTFANHLIKNNFDVELWNLQGKPDWFELEEEIKIKQFNNYDELTKNLEPVNAIKIATWWETAEPVWLASIKNGLPAYLVQDIESSYYHDDFLGSMKVESKYKPEFSYIVNYHWLEKTLAEEYRMPTNFVGLGVNLKDFFIDESIKRERNVILVAARSEPLKNFEYSISILNKLAAYGFKVIAFGQNKNLVKAMKNVEFHVNPTDTELRTLYNRAEYFLQTSIHEGFSLPPLEAMGCGCIPIVTDAFGNREYIETSKLYNVLFIEHDKLDESVAKIIELSTNDNDKKILRKGIKETSQEFDMDLCLDRLVEVLKNISKIEYGMQVDFENKEWTDT